MIEFIKKISIEDWKLYLQIASIVISGLTLLTVFVKMSYMKQQMISLRKSFDFERFKELSLLLASDVQAIRVAGILSLKELIIENTRYYSPVVDTYMSYLDEKLRQPNPIESDVVVQKIIHVLGYEDIRDLKFTDPYLSKKNHFQILIKSYFNFNTSSNLGGEPRKRIFERRRSVHQREYSLLFSKMIMRGYSFSNGFYFASRFNRSKLNNIKFFQTYLESTTFF
ncbi:hypothetical protein UB39_21450 [Photobacterium angustum]|nr:hypothetical protein UB39_21450 [Photobacterium angustum]